jgi:hypothetical protein
MLAVPDRSRWVPEGVEGASLLRQLPDGTRQYLLQRLRLEQSPSGALRRASDLLPSSRQPITAQALPERLGGGHLFVSTGTGTTLWKSGNFLGKLSSLTRLASSGVQVIPGADRLLVRMLSGDRVWGLDPETGALGPALPLPLAPRYGAMAFADAWRGAVYSDLQGLLVTRDAGVTWRPVPLDEAPRQLTIEEGTGVAISQFTGRRLRIDLETGQLAEEAPSPALAPSQGTSLKRPLGASPLRVALEDGWPLLDGTAVALRNGQLLRIKLDDGETLSAPRPALPGEEASTCSPVRFGPDLSFACGAPGQGTTLHAYQPPEGATLIRKFSTPRRVVPSQNGWLVVHGPCGEEGGGGAEGRYCILDPRGSSREIVTRGDVGVERVVALSDGRVAVVVPPRGGSDGVVNVLPAQGNGAPELVRIVPGEEGSMLRRGLWLDGMYEVEAGELGGWVESSGTLVGVRIKLADEGVRLGVPQDGGQFALAGPIAMVASGGEQLQESEDGGMTWKVVEMPPSLGQGKLRPGLRCGMTGCVVPFERGTWLRVGWGRPADPTDLQEALETSHGYPQRPVPRPIQLTCELQQQQSYQEVDPPPRPGRRPPRPVPENEEPVPLFPSFLGAPAPRAPEGSLALSEGTASGLSARLYGWVPRGVAAGRAGRLQVRFVDAFSQEHPVRSSALTVMSWQDEQALRDAFGHGPQNVAFHGLHDPGGKALLLSSCQGSACDLLGVVEGRPALPLPKPEGEPLQRVFPPSASAVWQDETFFVAVNTGPQVQLWRAEAGQTRQIAQVPRVTTFHNQSAAVTLVRRARGGLLGLLARGTSAQSLSDQELLVLPLDPTTGKAADPVRLGSSELSWAPVRPCAPEDDGWLIRIHPTAYPQMKLPPGVRLGEVELQARVDPGSICIEAIAARLLDPMPTRAPAPPAAPPAPRASGGSGPAIPMLASAPGKRASLACRP